MNAELDFLSIYFSNPALSPFGVLSVFLLIFVRFIGIVSMAPFLGAKLVPAPMRIGFCLSLAFIYMPMIIVRMTADVPFDLTYLGLAFKEFGVGWIIGFIATVPFYIAETSGTLIDYQRGASQLMSQDITMQAQVSSLGILYNNVLLVLFYDIGGTFIFLSAVLKTFKVIPVEQWINTGFFATNNPFWAETMTILHYVTALGIQLAAPALVAILMAESFLGIANRLAPQVQIAFLGMSLKSLLGLLLLFLAWYFIIRQMGLESLNWFEKFRALIWAFNPPAPAGA